MKGTRIVVSVLFVVVMAVGVLAIAGTSVAAPPVPGDCDHCAPTKCVGGKVCNLAACDDFACFYHCKIRGGKSCQ